jgi:DNA-binding MarR family transcriptional regulator
VSSSHQTAFAIVAASPSRQPQSMPLDDLSQRIRLSKQTIVRWVDRHLVDAELFWALSDDNREVRMIELTPQSLKYIEEFAADYREDVVSRTEARRILKQIDRKKIKKLIRAGDVKDVEVDDETRIVVGSIEDYLMSRERETEAAES